MEHRAELYKECEQKLVAMLKGESDEIVKMATISSLLSHSFPEFYWTGFYRVINGELVIGPYQGTLGCTRIQLGSGVCGTAAATGETQIVEDVHAFDGHIACDAASNSEIVIPVYQSGEVIAVLDIDSTEFGSFGDIDAEHLERILAQIF